MSVNIQRACSISVAPAGAWRGHHLGFALVTVTLGQLFGSKPNPQIRDPFRRLHRLKQKIGRL